MPHCPTRKLTIFALDPAVKVRGRILRTQIEIPNESLDPGPRGSRVHIVDCDSSHDTFQSPIACRESIRDPFEHRSDAELLDSREFHSWMTYGIVMKTLARFEYALGRRIAWGFAGHQIHAAPHAFSGANAFYSDHAHGLYFGYFPSADGKRRVFTCLSHEIVAHETAHALLDGLRARYTDPSSPQQAGFHEGFADVIALLSILSAQSVIEKVVDLGIPGAGGTAIRRSDITTSAVRKSGLFGLAQEMGSELAGVHAHALRRSISLPPRTGYLTSTDSGEEHDCGEILVAAVLNAYLAIWVERLKTIGDSVRLDRRRAAEEGAELADRLLTVCVRAIDYCPPTDIEFSDFASALLTADWELNPRDDKYKLRTNLYAALRAYGIYPRSKGGAGRERGTWDAPPQEFRYSRTHFDPMKSDPDELFRFVWENRDLFKLHQQAYTRVLSVRPSLRTGRDGFTLCETVAEYHQQLTVLARELNQLNIRKPRGMPDETEVTVYGGNTVIFDEYGHVKYNIGKSIMDVRRQTQRLAYLWEHGAFERGIGKSHAISRMHLRRNTGWCRK